MGQGDRPSLEGLDRLTWMSLVEVPAVVESCCTANLSAGVVGGVSLFSRLHRIQELAPHDGDGWSGGRSNQLRWLQSGGTEGVLESGESPVVALVICEGVFSPLAHGVDVPLSFQHEQGDVFSPIDEFSVQLSSHLAGFTCVVWKQAWVTFGKL